MLNMIQQQHDVSKLLETSLIILLAHVAMLQICNVMLWKNFHVLEPTMEEQGSITENYKQCLQVNGNKLRNLNKSILLSLMCTLP